MNIIKGFALNRTFIDNTPGVVAGIGELSTMGFTFSKEPRIYSSATYATISLVHFPSINSDVGYTAPIPDAQKDHILKVINAVYTRASLGNTVIPPGVFVEYLINQMGNELADITTGGTIISGTRSIIEWVQWRNTTITDQNVNKVWFVNDSFVGQFDEGEVEVVLPFDDPDRFFGQPADVKDLLTNLTYSEEMQRIQAARNETSETTLWGQTFDYINPVNTNDKTPAKFTALLYGSSVNNIDIIKEAIVNKLLTGSAYTRDQWKNILPEIFRRSEFMLFPDWNKMAIEHVVGSVNGIYSPVVDLTTIINRLITNAFEYDEAHIRLNAQAFTFPYMSVSISCIGHIENREDKVKITDWFPDYFMTNSTSADFSRMTPLTQEWVLTLAAMMPIARDMTNSSSIPLGYSRVIRGNVMFLSKNLNNMQYLLASPNQP